MLSCEGPIEPPGKPREPAASDNELSLLAYYLLRQLLSADAPANTEVARKSFGSRFGAADFDHIDMDCLGMKRGWPTTRRRPISEGGTATVGRWSGDGRKVERRTEGEQTADGRWKPPTNFGHLVGDLLGMRNFISACPNLVSIADTLLPPPQCRTVTNDGRKV